MYLSLNSNVNIQSSKFSNNTAAFRGGSIYVDANSRLVLNQVDFEANRVIQSRGGDVMVEGGSVEWNGGSSLGRKLLDENLSSSGQSGGSVSSTGASVVKIRNVIFRNHNVSWHGAALYGTEGASSWTVENIIAENGTAISQGGGAISMVRNDSFALIQVKYRLLFMHQLHCTKC
jgi:predicted outer membrane repeat protein